MRVLHKVNVQISNDTDQTDKLFWPDDTAAQEIVDAYSHCNTGTLYAAGGATVTVPFGEVAAPKAVFLKITGGIAPQIVINGGAPIQMRPSVTPGSSTTPSNARFFIEADISSLQLVAPTGTPVNGIFAIWGDAAS